MPRDQWTINKEAHEAIVDPELWERAQDLLDERRHPGRGIRRSYLLSGLLVCGLCGAAITGSRQVRRASGLEYYYYRCSSKYLRGWHTCDLPSFRVEALDESVLANIRTAIMTPARIQELVAAVNERLEAASSPAHDQRAALVRQLAGLEQRIANILDAIETLGIGAGDVAMRLQDLTARKKRVELELDALTQQLARLRPLEATPAQIQALVESFQTTITSSPLFERQELLRSFVQEIKIWPDRGQISYLPPIVSPAATAAGFQRSARCRGGDSNPYRRYAH
ncbi:MAG: recombinase zinc beta ribbon domain-containing protein [Chloroflexi bacterium]|nr:recombinase zinc beta ribbon domain-containing protein [Chloroflexota bacterium]MBU1749240.1 recombinase zinc beta ribbon domain-containing protein [Chloroflexota bacterium]